MPGASLCVRQGGGAKRDGVQGGLPPWRGVWGEEPQGEARQRRQYPLNSISPYSSSSALLSSIYFSTSSPTIILALFR